MSPEFRHSPMHRQWSMIIYDRYDRKTGPGGLAADPLEFNFSRPKTHRAMIKHAKFEAEWRHGRKVKVRDFDGTIIFDGEI